MGAVDVPVHPKKIGQTVAAWEGLHAPLLTLARPLKAAGHEVIAPIQLRPARERFATDRVQSLGH